ncbi:MAG: hypothetical protein ABW321_05380 [Polyangiales bacterium]
MPTSTKVQSFHADLVQDLTALQNALDLILGLPQHVRARVVIPHTATSAAEPSLSATRLRGYDAAGELCVYQHEFKLASIDFDADDEPYVRVSLHETVTAVRTYGGTWLRRVERCEPEEPGGNTHSDTGFCTTRASELPR